MHPSPDSPPVAHFFWHGEPLSLWTRACISSFVRHGFEVRMHSFGALEVPAGVTLHDAAKILPFEMIETLTQAGQRGSLAAFSDFFRYKVLAEEGGWWFDTDIFCLKPAATFFSDHRNVAGHEAPESLNCAALKLEPEMARRLFDRAMETGARQRWRFAWGDVGPRLVTRFFRELPEDERTIVPHSVFYPYRIAFALDALHPQHGERIAELCAGAHTFHYWNEILSRHGFPKNILPPEGSFLHRTFTAHHPELAELPTLPLSTLKRLALPPYPTLLDLLRWGWLGIRGKPVG